MKSGLITGPLFKDTYAADGTLLAVYEGSTGTAGRINAGSMVLTRDAGNVLTMESASWEGGRILPGTGTDKLIYQITDHLGSVRVIKDGEGTVLQRFDYYPFGSESRVWTAGTSTPQSALRYRFGGKEIAGQKVSVSTGTPAAAAGSPYLDFGARVLIPGRRLGSARTPCPRSTTPSVPTPTVPGIR